MTSRDCSVRRLSCWRAALLFWAGTAVVVSSAEKEFEQQQQFTTPRSYTTTAETVGGNKCSYDDYYYYYYNACCDNTSNFCLDKMDCLRDQIKVSCYHLFQVTMERHNITDRCVWSNVKSAYNNFSKCTENIAECLIIPWPNPVVEQTFLDVHGMYFRDCPTEELSDPPPGVVLALVMTPICLIPVMVVLVVLKTKNGDGSS